MNSKLVYRPALVGIAQIRYLDRRYDLDTVVKKSVLISNPDKRGMVHWKEYENVPVLDTKLTQWAHRSSR